jgi:hypothetical protein
VRNHPNIPCLARYSVSPGCSLHLKSWAFVETFVNQLELVVVLAAILTFGPKYLQDRDVLCFVDNTPALSACIHGYAKDTDMAAISNLLHLALAQLQCTSWFEFVNSAANIADLPTRPHNAVADDLYAQPKLLKGGVLRLPTPQELKHPRMRQLFASCGPYG